MSDAQYLYYCVQHPGKYAAWCAQNAPKLQEAIQAHKHHFFPISDLERLHKIMGIFDHAWVFWGAVAVGAYFVGRIGLPAVWSDLTGLFGKAKGLFGGKAKTGTPSTGTTPVPTPAPAA